MKSWINILLIFIAVQARASSNDVLRIKQEIGECLKFQRNIASLLERNSGGRENRDRLCPMAPQYPMVKQAITEKGRMVPHIKEAAAIYRLPFELLYALVKVESDFSFRVSPKGAIGPTQLLPSTARELQVNPWDSRQNIRGGACYLRQMYNRYGSIERALWAYNAGPGRVDKSIFPNETRKYIRKVMDIYREMRQENGDL